ncbi:MAG: MBL fold metallo-hydrolase [Victivallaceae bacterium]|nr:MBL fold metallo-hydrolase [Victivallaceae bacterium]
MEKFNIAVLGSGSKGNAFVVGCGGLNLLIDAGFTRRELLRRLVLCDIDPTTIHAVLVTHEHDDHIKGARVFCDEMNIPLCIAPRTADYLRCRGKLPAKLKLFSPGDDFLLCGFSICGFPVHHDAVEPVGFVISGNGRKIGIATDLGCVSQAAAEKLNDCDALLIESNYDLAMLRDSGRPFELKRRIMGQVGHLNNLDTVKALPELLGERTRHLVFTHVSRECNRYDIVERLGRNALSELGRDDILFDVARQDDPLPTFYV